MTARERIGPRCHDDHRGAPARPLAGRALTAAPRAAPSRHDLLPHRGDGGGRHDRRDRDRRPQAFTWLLVLFVTFFIPSALASAELGAALPEEGGAYVWVRTAFGRFAGALTSLLYWVGTPMWLGGSVTVVAIAVYESFYTPLTTAGQLAFGVVFIGGATIGAVVPLRYGKWLPSSGAIGQIGLLIFFVVIGDGVRGTARIPRDRSWTASRRRSPCSSRSCRSCCTRSWGSSCRRPRPRRWSTPAATSRSRSRERASVSC